MIRKVLVANRGEIAVRVVRACKDLGIRSAVAHSEADRESLAVHLADEALCIGPAAAKDSYLNQDAILDAAWALGADAVHPGYGFLAENADFAQACAKAGVQFVGPPAEAISLMGNKMAARESARAAGVPVIPGSHSAVTPDAAVEVARQVGYPLLLKAASGGGGRGLRRVDSDAELRGALSDAAAEAGAAFGDASMYMERYIARARHIEIQVLVDRFGKALHLGERDCTIQRRFQKLIEEAPSPAVTPKMRVQMAEAALALVRKVGYEGAGTLEFLLDQDTGQFYFIEMNTRLQVEHPVTEEVTGLDIVALQLEIAAGLPLEMEQGDIALEGHAIEFRINAEDPEAGFRPSAGRIEAWMMPAGPGVRVDTHAWAGYLVPPYYDSLLAKLVVTGKDRTQVMARARRALEELSVSGVKTTAPFHLGVLEHPDFQDSRTHTQWVAELAMRGEV